MQERLNMKELLERLSSRKFLLTITTFLLFVFSKQLGFDETTKSQLLIAFLAYIGIEGTADIATRIKSK